MIKKSVYTKKPCDPSVTYQTKRTNLGGESSRRSHFTTSSPESDDLHLVRVDLGRTTFASAYEV